LVIKSRLKTHYFKLAFNVWSSNLALKHFTLNSLLMSDNQNDIL